MKTFKSGVLLPKNSYRYFKPEPIFRQWTIEDPQIIHLLGKADRMLGRLDMFSQHVPNVDMFIQMHVRKEAVLSSKIEGTQTNMEEALQEKENLPEEKRNDWQEVKNYLDALNWAVAELQNLPLSSRLIRQSHKLLLQGVRGTHKAPGEFRRSQNWVGGASLNDARFIPPAHEEVAELMGDLEHFIHREDDTFPELLRIALIHYQFETIHPFLDGNGRIGRLLIPLYLIDKKILQKPVLYISHFFEKNRDLYYENLTGVRARNDLAQWFKFFLEGIVQTAELGVRTLERVLSFEKQTHERLGKLGARAHKAKNVIDSLYANPYISGPEAVAKLTGSSQISAYRLLKDLVRLGILEHAARGGRKRGYFFRGYLEIFTSE